MKIRVTRWLVWGSVVAGPLNALAQAPILLPFPTPTWARPLFEPPVMGGEERPIPSQIYVQEPVKPLLKQETSGHVPLSAAPARLLDGVRAGEWDEQAARVIARCSMEAWAVTFSSHEERVAAYLNLYNAYSLHLTRPANLASARSRKKHFARKQIEFARLRISLDDLEHALLRRGTYWWSLGYLRNPFPPDWQRYLRPARLDPRIHFALNCGATSCPPIRHYHAQWLEAQLETATRHYLSQTVEQRGDTLFLPMVFRWFPGDFGGKAGIRRLLQRHGLPTTGRWHYTPWNWQALPEPTVLPPPAPPSPPVQASTDK